MANEINSASDAKIKAAAMSDKAFMKLIITAVVGILLCATGLVSTTWAWYTANVSCNDNKISSASFGIDVSVFDDATGNPVNAISSDDGIYSLAKGTYTVTIDRIADSTATAGYTVVTDLSDSLVKYYTVALTASLSSVTFTIDVEREEGTTVQFKSNWGSPAADEKISHGGNLTFS